MAKQGQMDAVKIMAKDLVRTRRYVKKAMGSMNKQMKLPEIQKIMMEFEKQSEIMDMKGEMMEDAIDDVMGDEDDEEESDAIVNQVLDELGLQLNDKLGDVPVAAGSLAPAGAAKNKTAVAAGGGADDDDADLQARLDDLRRD